MKRKQNDKNGFIAIISLLIIATISMIIAITMLKGGVDNAALSLYSIYYGNAKMNSSICVEDTLYRIRLESQFTRDLNYNLGQNQGCTTDIQWYTPQSTGPGTIETLVDLTVTGTSGNFTRSFLYSLRIKTHDVNRLDGTTDYMNNIDIISIEEVSS